MPQDLIFPPRIQTGSSSSILFSHLRGFWAKSQNVPNLTGVRIHEHPISHTIPNGVLEFFLYYSQSTVLLVYLPVRWKSALLNLYAKINNPCKQYKKKAFYPLSKKGFFIPNSIIRSRPRCNKKGCADKGRGDVRANKSQRSISWLYPSALNSLAGHYEDHASTLSLSGWHSTTGSRE